MTKLRILFLTGVSPANGGGSWRSTVDLAHILAKRGHQIVILHGRRRKPGLPYFYKRATNLAAKATGTWLASPVSLLTHHLGRSALSSDDRGFVRLRSRVPENALPFAITTHRPHIVVASSLPPISWRRTRCIASKHNLPLALYLRESVALNHLLDPQNTPGLVLSNALAHATMARTLGHDAVVVPSVIDTNPTKAQSTKAKILFINPVATRGLEIALDLAHACRDLPFVFQESWTLTQRQWRELSRVAARMPNVELRRARPDPSLLYADARILLVPYRVPNRPRVILEAQANGIPVLCSRLDGLIEATGPGGIAVDLDAPTSGWVSALYRLWGPEHSSYAQRAQTHSERLEAQPDAIAELLEETLTSALRLHGTTL